LDSIVVNSGAMGGKGMSKQTEEGERTLCHRHREADRDRRPFSHKVLRLFS